METSGCRRGKLILCGPPKAAPGRTIWEDLLGLQIGLDAFFLVLYLESSPLLSIACVKPAGVLLGLFCFWFKNDI